MSASDPLARLAHLATLSPEGLEDTLWDLPTSTTFGLILAACGASTTWPAHLMPQLVARSPSQAASAWHYLTAHNPLGLRRLAQAWQPPPVSVIRWLVTPSMLCTPEYRANARRHWPELDQVPGLRPWLIELAGLAEGQDEPLALRLAPRVRAWRRAEALAQQPPAAPRVRHRA